MNSLNENEKFDSTNMDGKISIVTGANSGIGKQTAKELANMGARVIMVCRSRGRGEKAYQDIMADNSNAQLDLMFCDLSSFSQMRQFVEDFQTKYDSLQLLINNAGIYHSKYKESEDGVAMMMAVNHFSPFLLTDLLQPMLKANPPSRIINVNSGLHKMAKLDEEDLKNLNKCKKTGMKGYGISKFANLLTIYYRAKQLEGSGVTINAVSPGMVKTGIARHSLLAKIFWTLIGPFIKTAEEGAKPVLYLATSPELEDLSGKYFDQFEMAESSKLSYKDELQKEMWEISKKIVGL